MPELRHGPLLVAPAALREPGRVGPALVAEPPVGLALPEVRCRQRPNRGTLSDLDVRTDDDWDDGDRLTVRSLVSLPGCDDPVFAARVPVSALRGRLHSIRLPPGDQLTLVERAECPPWH